VFHSIVLLSHRLLGIKNTVKWFKLAQTFVWPWGERLLSLERKKSSRNDINSSKFWFPRESNYWNPWGGSKKERRSRGLPGKRVQRRTYDPILLYFSSRTWSFFEKIPHKSEWTGVFSLQKHSASKSAYRQVTGSGITNQKMLKRRSQRDTISVVKMFWHKVFINLRKHWKLSPPFRRDFPDVCGVRSVGRFSMAFISKYSLSPFVRKFSVLVSQQVFATFTCVVLSPRGV